MKAAKYSLTFMERAQELFTLIVLPLALIPIVGTLVWVGVCLIGDFSWRQGFVIAVLFCSLWLLHEIQVGKQKVPLRPFFVWIEPNWHELLTDYGLVKSPAECSRIWEQSEGDPSSKHDVFSSGIKLTFLSQELVYWNVLQCFTRWADLHFPLEGIKLDTGRKASGQFSPEMYIKPGPHGYELGIEVETDWWKEIRSVGQIRVEVAATEAREWGYNRTDLMLATIPREKFLIHECNPKYYWKYLDQIHKRLNAARDKWGWKEDETLSRWTNHLEHKYFVLEHREV